MAVVEYSFDYDRGNPISIEAYSQKLIGKTFRQIIDEDEAIHSPMVSEDTLTYGGTEVVDDKRNKGKLGQIIEAQILLSK